MCICDGLLVVVLLQSAKRGHYGFNTMNIKQYLKAIYVFLTLQIVIVWVCIIIVSNVQASNNGLVLSCMLVIFVGCCRFVVVKIFLGLFTASVLNCRVYNAKFLANIYSQ